MSDAKIQVRWPTVLLIEHGDTDFAGSGDEDRIHGTKFDLPLTEKGRQQMRRTAEILADYDVASLKHSPMLRSEQSAGILGDATEVEPEEEEALLPWDSGFASGMTHGAAADIVEYYVKNPDKVIRDGEAYGDWWETFSRYMAKRLKEAKKTKGENGLYRVLVDGVHSSEVTAAPAIIKGEPAQVLNQRMPGPGQIAGLEERGGRWRFIPKYT